MFKFFKKRNKNVNKNLNKEVRESPEIAKARQWIESLHCKSFTYMKTTEKGGFKRYHFYPGNDSRYIYVVLSDEERNEITKAFKEKMGDSYAYQDSMLLGTVQHRFYRPKSFNTSITFMDDDGEIWGGNFGKGEDMFD